MASKVSPRNISTEVAKSKQIYPGDTDRTLANRLPARTIGRLIIGGFETIEAMLPDTSSYGQGRAILGRLPSGSHVNYVHSPIYGSRDARNRARVITVDEEVVDLEVFYEKLSRKGNLPPSAHKELILAGNVAFHLSPDGSNDRSRRVTVGIEPVEEADYKAKVLVEREKHVLADMLSMRDDVRRDVHAAIRENPLVELGTIDGSPDHLAFVEHSLGTVTCPVVLRMSPVIIV